MDESPPRAKLHEVALLFLRLGFTAFGGPAAHVALMEQEVVRKRKWISHARFLDMLGASNLIPGPSSSELAVFIGYEQAGLAGLAVAGVCFVLPAASMAAALAWAYQRYGALPRVGGILQGVKPVMIAIVIQALWGLAPKALKRSARLAVIGVIAAVASAFSIDPLAVLVGAGALAALSHAAPDVPAPKDAPEKKPEVERRGGWLLAGIGAPASAIGGVGLGALFLTFLKLGAIVFGSGYVLLAFLRTDLVERHHWNSESQLFDAITVGQITPGPVFTTATFLGYLLHGPWGALLATVGIFLPGFVLVALIKPIVARLRRSPRAGAFLDGVNVGSLALMAVVTLQLARTILDPLSIAVAAVSTVLLLRFKVSPSWLLPAGALIGFAASYLR